jgi:hypothetical protein
LVVISCNFDAIEDQNMAIAIMHKIKAMLLATIDPKLFLKYEMVG